MREDLLEQLEKAYPAGFVFYYLDSGGSIRQSGHNLEKSNFLTAFHHIGMALATIMDKGE